MGESRGENFFFQSIPALDKGDERFRAPPFLIGRFESRPARDCRGKVKRINQPTALALTRVNVLVCRIQKLLNLLGPSNKGWGWEKRKVSVYVRVHDCVKLRSLGKVSPLLTSLLRQKLWECRVARLRNQRSFLLSCVGLYLNRNISFPFFSFWPIKKSTESILSIKLIKYRYIIKRNEKNSIFFLHMNQPNIDPQGI